MEFIKLSNGTKMPVLGYGTWRAMEGAYEASKVRAIGVSNFYADRYLDFVSFCEVKPMVNQMEVHVFQQQKAIRPYLDRFGLL